MYAWQDQPQAAMPVQSAESFVFSICRQQISSAAVAASCCDKLVPLIRLMPLASHHRAISTQITQAMLFDPACIRVNTNTGWMCLHYYDMMG